MAHQALLNVFIEWKEYLISWLLHGSTKADAAASAMHFWVVTHIYNSPVGNVAAHKGLLSERKALTSVSRVCPFRKKKKRFLVT